MKFFVLENMSKLRDSWKKEIEVNKKHDRAEFQHNFSLLFINNTRKPKEDLTSQISKSFQMSLIVF